MKEEFGTYKTESRAKDAVARLTEMGETAWNEGCTVYVDYEEADRQRKIFGDEEPKQ